MKSIQTFLNTVPLYRFVLYCLLFLVGQSVLFAFLGILPFSAFQFLVSFCIFVGACLITNFIFSHLFHVFTKQDSVLVTACILSLIFSPPTRLIDGVSILAIGIIAMTSKYLVIWNKKNIFNPAAFAAVMIGLIGWNAPSWWIATPSMILSTIIIGFLIIYRVRRFTSCTILLGTAFLTIICTNFTSLSHIPSLLGEVFTSWPLFFLVAIMFTEPMTMPPQKNMQIVYGIITGILFGARFQLGPFYSTPELALVFANVFSFFVNPKYKLFSPATPTHV